MSESEERLVKHFIEVITGLSCAIKESAGVAHLVTRCDLNAMEARLIKAIGERVNPKDLEKLSTKLEAASAPLEKAVAENQPG